MYDALNFLDEEEKQFDFVYTRLPQDKALRPLIYSSIRTRVMTKRSWIMDMEEDKRSGHGGWMKNMASMEHMWVITLDCLIEFYMLDATRAMGEKEPRWCEGRA